MKINKTVKSSKTNKKPEAHATNKSGKKKRTLTVACLYPTNIGRLGLFKEYNFLELGVLSDLPLNKKIVNRIRKCIQRLNAGLSSSDRKFIAIPERYWHLDAAVIQKSLSSHEKELLPSEWYFTVPQKK